ncbi:uncharacterized protein UV8b_05707 [Ustilaginoidea virens]|uniref:Uncharacterized protein n=1 Tax=Ustilaginoidea virens TaxID=1159556 RepID=A0A8E5HUF9_USTVR|nr:uncharacterized protein UV8b_05707 [Ustilaginoidea virens]QUC21464.1 hypothetical protein UV8b_05707 [Ustilaginoidea virens]
MRAILSIAFGLSAAAAAAAVNVPRDGDNDDRLPQAPWVTVNDEGNPVTTLTPAVSSVSGTPSPVDAAPHDLTASLYTVTNYGHVYTSTGLPPNPTATNAKTNEGSFSRCFNQRGAYAPFCRPTHNSTIYTGRTYYVTWDPDWYNATLSPFVSLRINYYNDTNGQISDHDVSPKSYPVSWGFLPLPVTGDNLRGHHLGNNVTLQLVGHPISNTTAATNHTVELPVTIANPPFDPTPPTPVPRGDTLKIALPVTFGVVAFLVLGVCLWNRKTRRIELGNIMSRSRRGYTGRRQRNHLFSRKDHGIQLDDAGPPADYRDAPDRAGRDSRDSRDSHHGPAAGSPGGGGGGTFEEQDTTGGRNAFRDEVRRQERERGEW